MADGLIVARCASNEARQAGLPSLPANSATSNGLGDLSWLSPPGPPTDEPTPKSSAGGVVPVEGETSENGRLDEAAEDWCTSAGRSESPAMERASGAVRSEVAKPGESGGDWGVS